MGAGSVVQQRIAIASDEIHCFNTEDEGFSGGGVCVPDTKWAFSANDDDVFNASIVAGRIKTRGIVEAPRLAMVITYGEVKHSVVSRFEIVWSRTLEDGTSASHQYSGPSVNRNDRKHDLNAENSGCRALHCPLNTCVWSSVSVRDSHDVIHTRSV